MSFIDLRSLCVLIFISLFLVNTEALSHNNCQELVGQHKVQHSHIKNTLSMFFFVCGNWKVLKEFFIFAIKHVQHIKNNNISSQSVIYK